MLGYLQIRLFLPNSSFAGVQDSALSPLLFALVMEPLAQTIQAHPEIHGYTTEYTSNKTFLYADYISLYVTQPQTTIPLILNVINLFGTFSGYRINWGKSESMPIQMKDHEWLKKLPFRITLEKFTYLGIVITKKYSSLFEANFTPLINKLQNNIQFWRTLPIFLLGRVNAIKMIFLPQLLYLLQNIPVYLTKSFFLNSIII